MDKRLKAFLDELRDGYPPFDGMEEVGVNTDADGGPLSYAIVQDRLDIVRLLLEHGANPAVTDSYGYTALDVAVECKRSEMIPLLKSYGAQLHMMGDDDLSEVERKP
ncbi:MAG: ankyrin repeat domain-containing protein [Patescibacteria group bacterium]|nr:ankyrin repeat domain-containing protein [Patescibacteria group bacterium]